LTFGFGIRYYAEGQLISCGWCTGASHQSEARLSGEVRPGAGLIFLRPVPFFESSRCRDVDVDVDVDDGSAHAHNINIDINAQVFREKIFARHVSFT
jgi:hypothetical protein